jgi:signal transduction histidine kinase
MLLASIALGLYVWVAVPLLRYHETHDRDDVQAAALVIGLWIATALVYPQIYRFAAWLVDKVLLHRVDYEQLETELASEVESVDTVDEVLDLVGRKLKTALTARNVRSSERVIEGTGLLFSEPDVTAESAVITIPTADEPRYTIELRDFAGGRRLLSDEIALLRAASIITARRIDLVRVAAERYEQRFREQEFAKLATEAQLAALRAQINPHFLFNALTTIGYLIQTAPDKASETLIRLTRLLRGVLNAGSDFSTLDDEIKLIENYLDIERARFEERLRVEIDVPEELRRLRIPSLILQPIVENAIKHAVSENKNGGTVRIKAEMNGDVVLKLSVTDTGSGGSHPSENGGGVGLQNVRERLASYYGVKAGLEVNFVSNEGKAELRLPVGS